jgi:hypothetical protein
MTKLQKRVEELQQDALAQKSRLEAPSNRSHRSRSDSPRKGKFSRQPSGDPDAYDPDDPDNFIDRMSGRQSGLSEFVKESSR